MDEEANYSYKIYKNTSSAWDAMFEALQTATRSIFWEIYILIDDDAGKRFVDILCEKALTGIDVKLIIDAFGSARFSDASEERLIKCGAKVQRYNRLRPPLKLWNWYYRLVYRNHRKVLIIDEETVFLGGVNIRADFKDWNDVFIKLSGRIAEPLLRAFAKSYVSSGGNRTDVKEILKKKFKIKLKIPDLVEKFSFIIMSPSRAKLPKTKLFYLKVLTIAKERVNLLTPYFVPDIAFLQGIKIASARGVKINIFLPFRSDLLLMELLSKTYFEETIKSGASIYLMPKMNHGKALTVDTSLGLIGSINLMPRSFSHHEESAVSFSDPAMVADLNAMFEELKVGAEEVNIDRWRKRSAWQRLREWVAKIFEYFV